jgi:hypothetical protein
MPKRSKEQIERLRKKRARSAKTGKHFVIHTKSGSIHSVVRDKGTGRTMPKAETYGPTISKARSDDEDPQQPRPKIPLLSGGKDPTLGERFEEELYSS